ncbi:MAG: hypothetical protein ACNA8R_06930, partial [Nitriliruptoraceae bacterium]
MTGQQQLHVYVAGTALAALAAVLVALPRVDPVPGIILMIAVFTAERFASVLRERVAVSVSSIVLLVAVLYGGAYLAIVGALGSVPAFAMRRS